MLNACMKRIEITPPKGLELAGYPHYPRYNEGAHDPLYAACMYLENDGEIAVMVTLDLLFFSKKHVKSVRENVNALCGIPKDSIMISCSHTHSAPWAAGRLDIESLEAGKEQPKEYVEELIDKITNLIVDAKNDAYPAYFTSGTAICGQESGIGGNRRIKGGPHDPLVSVMAIKDKTEKLRGMLVNYTLHPTFIHEWSNVCTANYPCYLKKEIEETKEGVIVGFSQGTSGNQSSRYYREGESYDEAERVGRTLGKAALSVLENAKWTDELPIKIATDSIEYELRDFGTEEELIKQVEHDKAVYEELYAKYGKSENREEYYLWQNANLKCLGSEDQLGYIRLRKKGIKIELLEDENPCEIQVMNLGGTCVIGIQGEIFVEYGLYLKAMAGFGYAFEKYMLSGIRELGFKEENFIYHSNKTTPDYSKMLEQDGEADIVYSGPGWPGHLAFIDPVDDWFKPTMEEYLEQGAKVAKLHPLTIAQNSLHGGFGYSGDISKVPLKGAMMGPRDAMKAKNVLDMHGITTAGSRVAWQRLTSRLCIFGKPSQEVPASILQLRKNPTHMIMSENIAATIEADEYFQY